MSRFIVFNPDLRCIQGDVLADSPREAVDHLESGMQTITGNSEWHVYRAPSVYPDAVESSKLSAFDSFCLESVLATKPAAVLPNSRYAEDAECGYRMAC